MNERIKKLLEQACEYASRETTDLDEWQFIRDEKFAELIIRDVFSKIKESCVDTEVMERVDEVINDRLNDAASEICDDYNIVDRIY